MLLAVLPPAQAVTAAEPAQAAPAPGPTASAMSRSRDWRVRFENRSHQSIERINVSGFGWDNFDKEDFLGDIVLKPDDVVALAFPETRLVGHAQRRCSLPVEIVMADGSILRRDLDACTTAAWRITDSGIETTAR